MPRKDGGLGEIFIMLNEQVKIKNIGLSMRCIRKTLDYNGKKFNLYIIKDSPARTTLSRIIVNDLFFEGFNKIEQEAILYHEKYHQKFFTLLKKIIYPIKFLNFKKARWQEELDADNYAKNVVGKDAIKNVIIKLKKFSQQGKIVYNQKSHPPYEERIRNIERE